MELRLVSFLLNEYVMLLCYVCGQGHVTISKILWPNHIFRMGETRHFKFRVETSTLVHV